MKPSRTTAYRLSVRQIRRLVRDEPTTRVAIWGRRAALFALMLAIIAVATVRLRTVEPEAGLAVLTAALVFAVAAIPLAFAALVVIWRTGMRGARIALSGFFLAIVILAYPGFLTLRARQLPDIHDVSTDSTDPPAFSRSATALAARADTLPADPTKSTREAQARAYPDIQPIFLGLDPEDAYDLVVKTAGGMGWKVVADTPPGGRTGLGHVDAVARTFVMGFPEDVTVRITPMTNQTRIDVRSVSRRGTHDQGSNASRIRNFAAALAADPDAR